MSEANPVKAMSALIPEPITTPEGVVVRPLTLGTFALLERIQSPTLVKCTTDSLALLPSLYILTHDPREVLERFGELDGLAVAWADTLPPHAIGAIEAAAAVQIQRMLDVIAPEGDPKKKDHNGWIASLVQWIAETYHWDLERILWSVPASVVALMRRQWLYSGGKPQFTLSEIEVIDNGQF